jgi:hypothetical protein
MFACMLRLVLPMACSIGIAHADIYTWIDASGTLNVSNLAPPEGVRVVKVMHDSPPASVPARDPTADASRQAEVQFLAERVRQLEYQVDLANRQAPMPMPIPMQYAAAAPPVPQYVYDAPQPAFNECDPAWSQCGNWWGAPFYPATVVVVSPPGFHRTPPFRGGHRFPIQLPVRTPGGMRQR